MMLLDFYAGSHGHFLEYLINVYIFRCPRVDKIFTNLGTSHGIRKDAGYQDSRIIIAGHYSESNCLTSCPSVVIRLQIDSPKGQAIYQINVDCRAGDIPSEKKKEYISAEIQSSPCLLRNDYFSKLAIPEFGYGLPSNWRWTDSARIYNFPMESLFDLTALYSEMRSLSNFLNHSWNPDLSLPAIWNEFIAKNHGVQAWTKCKNILETALADKSLEIVCTPYEEALLNLMLKQTIGTPLFETDEFPKNTQEIYRAIQQYIQTFDIQF
jgi:hypothetical protein